MKLIKLFSAFFIVTTLVSCTLTENVYINNDGSGKFSVDMDASSLMAMMPNDSLKSEKNVDSTFSFKQLFIENKDSIAKLPKEEQEQLKKLENFNMRMKMDSDTKQFLFSMNTDFKSVVELQDVLATMNIINAIKNTNKNKTGTNQFVPSSGFGTNNSVLNYSYNGKKFIRKATIKANQIKKTVADSLQAYETIFASSNYILKYHFPKPVRKISNNTALFSEDRKTITIQYPFKEYMENPDKLNIEVEFE
jgi:hypothetical protein